MNILTDLRLAPRIGAAFAVTIALLMATALVGVLSLRAVNDGLHTITDDYYVKVRLAADLRAEVDKQARLARNVLIFDAAGDRVIELDAIRESGRSAERVYERLGPMVRSPQGLALMQQLLAERQQFRAALDRFDPLVREGRLPEARGLLLREVRPLQLQYMETLGEFADLQAGLTTAAGQAADEEVRRGTWWLAGVAALASLLAAASAWLIVRSITGPLSAAVRVAEAVAAGDLTLPVDAERRDEVGELLASLRHMTDGLAHIVTQVRNSSDSIATGAGQIASGNADLSQRTEEQAANLQQTAASMEQLTGTVRANAETARQAAALASNATAVALRGGDAVNQVVAMMQEVSTASRRMADIIGTIDGIAFQTNILALNAAVEAARAGEHGRGFAVVASEVRVLSQRSSQAAREIRQLIGRNVETVQGGSTLVGHAGTTMLEIVAEVRRVHELIGQISTATQEQTTGIGQVGDAVNQLDQVTQQNAALVEESAAAADSLNQQVRGLIGVVARFRLAALPA